MNWILTIVTFLPLVGVLAMYFASGVGTFNMLELEQAGIPLEVQRWAFPVVFMGFAILGGIFPLHSWAPVPGAASYEIQIDNDKSFPTPYIDSGITTNTFYTPKKYIVPMHYYWRVIPIDGSGNKGLASAVFEYDATA